MKNSLTYRVDAPVRRSNSHEDDYWAWVRRFNRLVNIAFRRGYDDSDADKIKYLPVPKRMSKLKQNAQPRDALVSKEPKPKATPKVAFVPKKPTPKIALKPIARQDELSSIPKEPMPKAAFRRKIKMMLLNQGARNVEKWELDLSWASEDGPDDPVYRQVDLPTRACED